MTTPVRLGQSYETSTRTQRTVVLAGSSSRAIGSLEMILGSFEGGA